MFEWMYSCNNLHFHFWFHLIFHQDHKAQLSNINSSHIHHFGCSVTVVKFMLLLQKNVAGIHVCVQSHVCMHAHVCVCVCVQTNMHKMYTHHCACVWGLLGGGVFVGVGGGDAHMCTLLLVCILHTCVPLSISLSTVSFSLLVDWV